MDSHDKQETIAADKNEIARAVRLLSQAGDVRELRALDAITPHDRRPHTESGYFDDADKLAAAAAAIPTAGGIYLTLNPVKPELLARSVNKARAVGKSNPTTADHDVARRAWLLVDCDPVRPTGIAASDDEHKAALVRATDIDCWLYEQGWPAAIVADSGNGGHLLYAIDLPVDDAGIVERCLKALAVRWDCDAVKVDTTVQNAARIVRLYGCVNGKGDAEAAAIGRPHRMARILNAPETIESVSREKLEALAALAPQTVSTPSTPRSYAGDVRFDLDDWIRRSNLDVSGPEPWKGGGQRWQIKTCPWDPAHTGGSAFIVRWPNGTIGAGCHHNSCNGRDWHGLRDVVERGWRERKSGGNGQRAADRRQQEPWPRDSGLSSPVVVKLSEVQPEQVRWLWPGRIALGKLTLIAGEPGLGKSFFTLDVTARVTTGNSWPDDPSGFNQAGAVVLLSAEDDVADTIRPRLDAAGADVNHVVAIQGVEFKAGDGDKPARRTFNLERDLPALERTIAELPGCRLVVIDPVSAYCGKVDSHNNSETRGLLAPLADLAARYKVAVVVVTHLNKNAGSKAMHRFTGSIAFVAAARTAWLVAADKQNAARRLLLPVKNNLAEDRGGLAYGIVEGAVAWERGAVSMSADDAIGDDRQHDGHTERDDAADWLRELLADGPLPQKAVKEAAGENGVAWGTVRRAAKRLSVRSRKEGFGKEARWLWKLPAQRCTEDAEDAHPSDVSTLSALSEGEHLWREAGQNSADDGGAAFQ
jgi:hypothetical protein